MSLLYRFDWFGLLAAVLRASPWRVAGLLVACAAGMPTLLFADVFFEKEVRPLLAAKCYECHGPDRQRGQLRVDGRQYLLTGGKSGPALEPGLPDESLLIRAVRRTDEKLKMPPKAKPPLSPAEVDVLVQWVESGAPWPQADPARRRSAEGGRVVTAEDREHWAFRPLRRPAPPHVEGTSWLRGPVDRFVLARLEEQQLAPNPPADRRTLARRLYLDLVGLPPSPEETRAFLNDPAPDSYERLVERLLASPRYGERWGRHWLDLVRYAQTDGYEFDAEKPFAWRYRDYVISSLNEDKPYSRFILEQLAGDELDEVTLETLVATGYYRLGAWEASADDKRKAHFDELDDIVSTTGETFLGLTIGCARCHDHMTDAIPQRDYYRMLAIFHNVRAYSPPNYEDDGSTLQTLAEPAEVERWRADRKARLQAVMKEQADFSAPIKKRILTKKRAQLPESLRQAYDKPKAERSPRERALAKEAAVRLRVGTRDLVAVYTESQNQKVEELSRRVSEIQRETGSFDWSLVVRERGARPRVTHILARGDAAQPTDPVEPMFPAVLTTASSVGDAGFETDRRKFENSTGRRRALAEWIGSERQPLSARVITNRLWQHHFGRGIVATPNDFGKMGARPTHPLLLDWLARELIDSGWSLKRIHREIVNSSTYRMSSRAKRPDAGVRDPENRFFWRQNFRRLEAEALRDALLAVSGELNTRMGGRGIFPRVGRQALAGSPQPGLGWEVSPAGDLLRRSVYVFLKRRMPLPFFEGFDYTDMSRSTGARDITTVAPQALHLLNGRFANERSLALADRILGERASLPLEETDLRMAHVARAYALVLGRSPSPGETELALTSLGRQEAVFRERQGEIVFTPEVPESLASDYFHQLEARDLLAGPAEGWRYARGFWSIVYSNREVVLPRGPFALYEDAAFTDGIVSGTMRLEPGVVLGSLLVRGTAVGEVYRGLEVLLDPVVGRVELRRHGEKSGRHGETGRHETLASVPYPVETSYDQGFRLELDGERLSLWLGDGAPPVLDVRGLAATNGRFGVRAWGSALVLDQLRLSYKDRELRPGEAALRPGEAYRRALASYCLVLMNLNEFAYVD